MTTEFSLLFVSHDGGRHFTEHDMGIGLRIGVPVFADGQHAVVVAGAAMSLLYRTDDGGATWSQVPVPGPRAVQTLTYGTPAIVDSRFEVAVSIRGGDGAQSVSIYRSTDDGATFAPLEQPPLQIPAKYDGGAETAAILGNVIWLAAGGRIYESIDGGGSWDTTVARVSPYPLSPISGGSAIGVARNSGCLDGKTSCFSYEYPVVTSDGGRTWQDTY
jgi:photosystem II stability/assembly factor-like uncharacterized protein